METEQKRPSFGRYTALSIVIGNVVGTGVFAGLGFQLESIESVFVLLLLWVLGGVCALCGAMTYAELGARMPRSGGEYNYLRETYHPALGFMAGWTSVIIGFAAPIALVGLLFGEYLNRVFPAVNAQLSGSVLLVVVTATHLVNFQTSGTAQNLTTYLKVFLIALLCVACIVGADPQPIDITPRSSDVAVITSGSFAVALIYVNYAYTGWNAPNYLSGDLQQGSRTLTWSLLVGTAIVTVLYVLLNFTFLYVAPIDAMRGQPEVGYIAVQYALGTASATLMSLVLAFFLISTASAMILAGSRILQRFGEDERWLNLLGRRNRRHIPVWAVLLQSVIALAYLLTGSFQQILTYASYALGVSAFLTVLGIFIVRRRDPRPPSYAIPWYPVPPLIFLAITGWMLIFVFIEERTTSLTSLGVLLAGIGLYFIVRWFVPVSETTKEVA